MIFFTIISTSSVLAEIQNKGVEERFVERFIEVTNVEEASNMVPFQVSTLIDLLPREFDGVNPYVYVSLTPIDKSPSAVTQIWSTKGRGHFLALNQSPSLTGIVGSSIANIDGFDEQVQVHKVENENVPTIFIIHWKQNGIGYNLAGTLSMGLCEETIIKLAKTLK